MTPTQKRNLIKWPLVVMFRIPILLPLVALARLGEKAEALGEFLSPYLPSVDREPPHLRTEPASTLESDNG